MEHWRVSLWHVSPLKSIIFALMLAAGPTIIQAADTPAGKWLAEDINSGGVVDFLQTTLTIDEGGKVHGNGGCNSYSGTVTIDGQSIEFNRMMSTMMACPEAIMNQESQFHNALRDARSWHVEDTGHLILFNDKGEPLVRLIEN